MNTSAPARRPTHESTPLALETLLCFLGEDRFKDLRQFIQWDFLTRLHGSVREPNVVANKPQYLIRFISVTQPGTIHSTMIVKELSLNVDKQTIDVAFVAIIKEELVALQIALGIPVDRPEDYSWNGMRFWIATLSTATQREPINVIVTMVGAARNLECAAAMSTLFNHHQVRLCVLVGIAAGLKTKVALGDVVVAYDMILDYEGQRLEPSGAKKRPKAYPLNSLIKRDLEYFNPVRIGWHAQFEKLLPSLAQIINVPTECLRWQPQYVLGVILAGECLLADGSLPHMQDEYTEKVRAAEQEGSGFARMCDENHVAWLVFRGVSDYGELPKPDNYQSPAALAAASCAVSFVQRDYRSNGVDNVGNF